MRLNDFPFWEEIRSEYLELRRNGIGRSNAVNKLCSNYQDEITSGEDDDGILFWIGLADAQYENFELSLDVARRGLNALDAVASIFPIVSDEILSRKQNYLSAPMPERRKQPAKSRYRCNWKIGDTFALKLCGEHASKESICGQYVLLRKVDEIEFGDGRLLPVVTISLWDKNTFPTSVEEFLSVPFWRLESGRFGSALNKYEYRALILLKNESQLLSLPLEYVGCYPVVTMPEDETIFTNAGDMMMILPDRLIEDCCLFWRMNQYYRRSTDGSLS